MQGRGFTVGISTRKYNVEHLYTYHSVELTIDYTVHNFLDLQERDEGAMD